MYEPHAEDAGSGSVSIAQETLDIFGAMLLIGQMCAAGADVSLREDLRVASGILKRCAATVNRRRPGSPLLRPVLTPRERQMARLLAEGHAYKQICSELDVSLASVQATVKTIYLKLGVHSRTELTGMFTLRAPTLAIVR